MEKEIKEILNKSLNINFWIDYGRERPHLCPEARIEKEKHISEIATDIITLFESQQKEIEQLKEYNEKMVNEALKLEKTATTLGSEWKKVSVENLELKEKLLKAEERFNAAKNYIDESPCDPDITIKQLEMWNKYQELLTKE